MKTILKLFLFVILLALPFGVRYWQLYGLGMKAYEAPKIVQPDLAALDISSVDYQSYDDQPQQAEGHVLIDLGHANNLQVDDLTPLKERLAARGVTVRYYDYDSDYLSNELRGVTAFVVLAPTQPFYIEEVHAVQDFVSRGGLLLLVADPTRSVPVDDYYGYVDLYSLFFPESAIPAINSLANRFGIQFFEDYLYNLKDYDTNFRNVKINEFATSPLTAGLEQVVLFASHSLQTDGAVLLSSDEDTLSNVRTGETKLAAAAFNADENVLALGDLSLLTPPYHRAADNDRLLSNLADWLSRDQRRWALQDFPYLFRQPTVLASVSKDALNSAVLNLAGPLQQVFTQSGLELSWGQLPGAGRDVILAGIFAETEPISDVLASAGISITLATETTPDVAGVDETEAAEAEDGEADEDEGEEAIAAEPTAEPAETEKSTVAIEGIGTFELAGLQLFMVTHDGAQTALTILAEDRDGLSLAVQRLLEQDFEGCASQADVMLCAADAYAVWEEPAPEAEGGEAAEPVSGELDRVFILAVDSTAGAGRSSAAEWELALAERYDVTIWSTLSDGVPTLEDMDGFDAYIIDMGDFAYDAEAMDELPISLIDGNWLLIGEQPGDPGEYDLAPITDLVVTDPEHILASGLPVDEPMALSESESGVPALVLPPFEEGGEGLEVSLVLARGPNSEQADASVLQAYDFTDLGSRFAIATFAFYRLPEELQALFAENVVAWLLGQ